MSNNTWDLVQANWKQAKGKIKEQWGDMTDDEIMMLDGKKDQFVGKVQEKYNLAKSDAEAQVNKWANSVSNSFNDMVEDAEDEVDDMDNDMDDLEDDIDDTEDDMDDDDLDDY